MAFAFVAVGLLHLGGIYLATWVADKQVAKQAALKSKRFASRRPARL